MKVADFDFFLPKDLLAEYPSEKRGGSRLMVINRAEKSIEHHHFSEIASFFKEDDLLIRNTAKVKAVRFLAKKEHIKGANLELLLIAHLEGLKYEAFVDPLVKVKVGSKLLIGEGILIAEIKEIIAQRTVIIEFTYPLDKTQVHHLIQKLGKMPIPRYIKRKPEELDDDRYQTVYAKEETALAAPTSGLHFTKGIFKEIVEKGVEIADLNLEIGLGTFNPVYAEELLDHAMHKEFFSISQGTSKKINSFLDKKKRVIALGTTSIRATEAAFTNGKVYPGRFETGIFIYPPYPFKVADALITNFHTPRSTLLMLVCAFGGYDLIMSAYEEAIKERYRFYSYGDSMMIL